MPFSAKAQTASPLVSGDYIGTLGSLHLRLHLKSDASGGLDGTIDSPDQGANGIACTDFKRKDEALSFSVPSVHGTWRGTISVDGKVLTGTWDQGNPMPLVFTSDTFVPAEKPSSVDGTWLGNLQAGGASLRIQVRVKSDRSGKEYCSLDSLDQHATGLDCSAVTFSGDDFTFDIPVVKGHYAGKLSPDGNVLAGTWSQNNNVRPLTLARQKEEIAAKPIPPPAFDAAMAPVQAPDLKSVLDRDLAAALKSGELAPGTGAGVAIAIVDHGVRQVFYYGAAKEDSIYEIGSITKTFTGLILSQMVEQNKVKLEDPVRELLPTGTVGKPAGAEITLLDLATQHSGLPRMPDNFAPTNQSNPYADYHAANMYAFLAKHGVEKPEKTAFVYSNYGFGLLGQALSVRAGRSYPELLKDEVLEPLGMHDTTVALSPEQQARFLPGHTGDHAPAHAWDLDAFAGAGAIRSTASDMLIYLEANLHPGGVKPANGSAAAKTISRAITQDHELRGEAMGPQKVALAWLYDPSSGNYWHNGATGGFSSYAFFNPQRDYAAVVLLNTGIGSQGSFADRIGEHVSERLVGNPAISLGDY
ncbi:serine hydrolase domain-containing protein [Terriglobus albidus]|uniref:serine hydrolase domain-containing protein n=1 Tax=Terriglobus albidus TaxID=1592106 RepID=UPI0021DF7B7B|nr:serine hydrolase [Terriglobus albidus]